MRASHKRHPLHKQTLQMKNAYTRRRDGTFRARWTSYCLPVPTQTDTTHKTPSLSVGASFPTKGGDGSLLHRSMILGGTWYQYTGIPGIIFAAYTGCAPIVCFVSHSCRFTHATLLTPTELVGRQASERKLLPNSWRGLVRRGTIVNRTKYY